MWSHEAYESFEIVELLYLESIYHMLQTSDFATVG
jgi:hypothetical protein